MTIQRDIKRAKRLFLQFEGTLRGDANVAEKIEEYRAAISRTCHQMERMGVLAACSSCARNDSGSCCFNGVEEWYDAIPLLINLLMEVQLPVEREIEDGCLFVGSGGCRLIARNSFCVNYFCPDLLAVLAADKRRAFAAIAGEELLLGWELECSIRHRLERLC